jgi:hypothetical protein
MGRVTVLVFFTIKQGRQQLDKLLNGAAEGATLEIHLVAFFWSFS